jgi:hypothetical protein
VEQAITAALKNTVIFLLQNRHEETNASTAAKKIAAEPLYKNKAKKINTSETAI